MAKYRFSSLNDGDAVTFDPAKDVLFFDNCLLEPGAVTLLSCPSSVVLLADNQRVTLIGITVDQLGPDNVRFVGYDLKDPSATLAPRTAH
jgi:hypothetical protein